MYICRKHVSVYHYCTHVYVVSMFITLFSFFMCTVLLSFFWACLSEVNMTHNLELGGGVLSTNYSVCLQFIVLAVSTSLAYE